MNQTRLFRFSAWGLIVIGLLLRLRQSLAPRSLWLDEAMLALNILHKNFAGLLGKLDDNQGAPLGFLLLEKLAATLLGSGELSLRLLPLLAGCAALVVFYLLLRRLLTPAGILTALALFAFSPTLIYYASEVKQYSSDVLVTLVLLWLASENPRRKWNQTALFFVGALALWFSHPALFTLAAIGVARLIENRKNPAPTLALGAGWLVSLGALYLVNLRQLAGNQFLLEYWREYFRVNPLDALMALFANPAGLTGFAPALLAAAGLGAVTLWKRQPKAAGSFLLIFVFALAASWAQIYPFAGRMALFSVPLVFIFLAAGVGWLWNLSLRPQFLGPLLALALAGFMLYAPALDSAQKFLAPKSPEYFAPAMSALKQSYKPGDQIYVYYWALPAWRYYAPRYGFGETDILAGKETPTLPQEFAPLRGQARVWILFSHVYANGNFNEKDALLACLNRLGQKKRQFIEPGTSVYLYLYDLR